ncbi:MarR family transcriptional regulator [Aldersonia sp. NBC_00410]|uniref:MarR family winged helix-turn-helix transcriptional regulator n=1 Tax=Aldersonia sp. NBC_00410 TaxID=2975954 RepID=UPI00224DC14D|nr:MarR family transcriptional regulator [Aldersonia sp. NBC_00410]MCX5041936.1 MarR family transcriptional regulator [Aldersonia sp. NBC_00410]
MTTGRAAAAERTAVGDPDDLRDAVDVALTIGRLVRTLRRFGDAAALSPGSSSALATLVWSGPMRLGDLAAAERVTAPTMSRIVSGLDRSGYLVRTPDPDDGRAQLLAATEEGRALATGLHSARIHNVAAALDRLNEEQRSALVTSLAAFEHALED